MRANRLNGERAIAKLENAGHDMSEVASTLDDYASIERDDYDDAEEYSEARYDAWSDFEDALSEHSADTCADSGVCNCDCHADLFSTLDAGDSQGETVQTCGMCGEVAGRTYDCSHYLRSPFTVSGETLQLCADCFCAFRVDWMPDPAWSPNAEKLEKRIAEYADPKLRPAVAGNIAHWASEVAHKHGLASDARLFHTFGIIECIGDGTWTMIDWEAVSAYA